jgi:restriction system protein
MRNYLRVMLGPRSVYAKQCFEEGFIGANFGIDVDLTGRLPENWRQFNEEFIPVFLEKNPGKSKITAGLACGALHTICKWLQVGDVVISPDGNGNYRVGEVTGPYYYNPDGVLQHRRPIKWLADGIERTSMSKSLRNAAGSIGTVSNVSRFSDELESLIKQEESVQITVNDSLVEDPSVFALERHLEDFLVENWKNTELGKAYDLYQDGDNIGRQFPTDTGPIDLLAISKDKKELLVVELKKGRASDSVVGQIQRYMGYVVEKIAEENQTVKGVIIALEDDLRIRRALKVTTNISFYRYEVSFRLFKEI